MAGLPPKYAMQRQAAGQPQMEVGRAPGLPVDTQIALLRQRIDQLTAEVAALKSQMESECVRQYWNGEVHFPASTHVRISVSGNFLTLDASGLNIGSSARLQLNGSTIDVSGGMLSGNIGMAKFSGVVQCDSLVANSVAAASYTPGAGNVW